MGRKQQAKEKGQNRNALPLFVVTEYSRLCRNCYVRHPRTARLVERALTLGLCPSWFLFESAPCERTPTVRPRPEVSTVWLIEFSAIAKVIQPEGR